MASLLLLLGVAEDTVLMEEYLLSKRGHGGRVRRGAGGAAGARHGSRPDAAADRVREKYLETGLATMRVCSYGTIDSYFETRPGSGSTADA